MLQSRQTTLNRSNNRVSNNGARAWEKLLQATGSLHRLASLISDQNDKSEDDTYVSRALRKYYTEEYQEIPSWLETQDEKQRYDPSSRVHSNRPSLKPNLAAEEGKKFSTVKASSSVSLSDIYNRPSSHRANKPLSRDGSSFDYNRDSGRKSDMTFQTSSNSGTPSQGRAERLLLSKMKGLSFSGNSESRSR